MLSHIRSILMKDGNVRLCDKTTLHNRQIKEKNKIKFILPQKMKRSQLIVLIVTLYPTNTTVPLYG